MDQTLYVIDAGMRSRTTKKTFKGHAKYTQSTHEAQMLRLTELLGDVSFCAGFIHVKQVICAAAVHCPHRRHGVSKCFNDSAKSGRLSLADVLFFLTTPPLRLASLAILDCNELLTDPSIFSLKPTLDLPWHSFLFYQFRGEEVILFGTESACIFYLLVFLTTPSLLFKHVHE